jgi:hypothetical protein
LNKDHPNGSLTLTLTELAELVYNLSDQNLTVVYNGTVDFEKIEKFIFDKTSFYKNRKIQDFIDVWNLLGKGNLI